MKLFIVIIVFLCTQLYEVFAHPLHVSIANIDVISDSNRINYSIRIFYDDFQRLINSKYNTMIDFSRQNRMTTKEQQSILDYLNSGFVIMDSLSKVFEPSFLGWKIENMSAWFYFGMNFNGNSKKLIIENNLMNCLFTDQKNLLILNCSGNEQGFEYNPRNTKYEIVLY
jgi:hypothetical protein